MKLVPVKGTPPVEAARGEGASPPTEPAATHTHTALEAATTHAAALEAAATHAAAPEAAATHAHAPATESTPARVGRRREGEADTHEEEPDDHPAEPGLLDHGGTSSTKPLTWVIVTLEATAWIPTSGCACVGPGFW